MHVSKGVRQVHRGVSLAFALGVIANAVVIERAAGQPWVSLLALLLLTGPYLFALPYPGRAGRIRGSVG